MTQNFRGMKLFAISFSNILLVEELELTTNHYKPLRANILFLELLKTKKAQRLPNILGVQEILPRNKSTYWKLKIYPGNIYLFKANNSNTKKVWSMLKINKKDERLQWRHSGVLIVNFKQIGLVFSIVALNK